MHLSVVAFVSPRNRRRRRRRKCNPSKKECAEMMYSTIENCFEVFPHFFSVCPPTKELGWWWSKIVHYFTSKANSIWISVESHLSPHVLLSFCICRVCGWNWIFRFIELLRCIIIKIWHLFRFIANSHVSFSFKIIA